MASKSIGPANERGVLREDQIAAFRRDGFVFVPGFFDRVSTGEIDRWIDELAASPEEPGKHWVYHEDSLSEPGRKLVQRIEKFVEIHPGLNALCTGGRMHRAVSELLGEEAELFKEKINFKLPGGEGFKAHQDSQAGWGLYADYFVTALVTIDESTRENGCLEMAAGWHQKGLVGEEWKPLDEEATARLEFIPYPARPGDAMFFDSFAPHRSGPNTSSFKRRVLYVTYNRASAGDHRARYFADKYKNLPPDIEREPGKVYEFKV
jgi:hypothetical protein